jgi:hypothetical protein
MFKNKVFQAALAKNQQLAEKNRPIKSPGHAAPYSADIKKSSAGPAVAQQSKVLSSSAEARVALLAAPEPRPQNCAAPGTPPSATATFSSVVHDKSSGDSIGKRQRIDSISSPSEQGAERKRREDSDRDTPVTDRKPLATFSTQIRTPYLHAQRVEDPACRRPSLASPLSSASASRQNVTTTTQNQSPPTPIRNTTRAATAAHLPLKSPVPQRLSLQSTSIGTHASSFPPFNIKPAASSYSSDKKPSPPSPPPPSEPTPLCPAPSKVWAHQISAGFHNDGNTCYLRYVCSSLFIPNIIRYCSAALVILLSQAAFVNEVLILDRQQSWRHFHFTCILQLVSEYVVVFAEKQINFVRDFPCLAEVPSRNFAIVVAECPIFIFLSVIVLQLTSLATWKRFNPSRHLKRYLVCAVHSTALIVMLCPVVAWRASSARRLQTVSGMGCNTIATRP